MIAVGAVVEGAKIGRAPASQRPAVGVSAKNATPSSLKPFGLLAIGRLRSAMSDALEVNTCDEGWPG